MSYPFHTRLLPTTHLTLTMVIDYHSYLAFTNVCCLCLLQSFQVALNTNPLQCYGAYTPIPQPFILYLTQ